MLLIMRNATTSISQINVLLLPKFILHLSKWQRVEKHCFIVGGKQDLFVNVILTLRLDLVKA